MCMEGGGGGNGEERCVFFIVLVLLLRFVSSLGLGFFGLLFHLLFLIASFLSVKTRTQKICPA